MELLSNEIYFNKEKDRGLGMEQASRTGTPNNPHALISTIKRSAHLHDFTDARVQV